MMSLSKYLQDNRGILLFAFLLFCFRSTVADCNVVLSGSMEPSILVGDRVFVNKLAYDIRIPFTHISLYHKADPKRGDIIVFDSKHAGKKLIKRTIGIAGDEVQMVNNQLIINGQPAQYHDPDQDWLTQLSQPAIRTGVFAQESLAGLNHPVRFNPLQLSPLRNFEPVQVPPGYVLVLGDNRDNSADSRVHGLVPLTEITGQALSVVVSLDKENRYLPRPDRLFWKLP